MTNVAQHAFVNILATPTSISSSHSDKKSQLVNWVTQYGNGLFQSWRMRKALRQLEPDFIAANFVSIAQYHPELAIAIMDLYPGFSHYIKQISQSFKRSATFAKLAFSHRPFRRFCRRYFHDDPDSLDHWKTLFENESDTSNHIRASQSTSSRHRQRSIATPVTPLSHMLAASHQQFNTTHVLVSQLLRAEDTTQPSHNYFSRDEIVQHFNFLPEVYSAMTENCVHLTDLVARHLPKSSLKQLSIIQEHDGDSDELSLYLLKRASISQIVQCYGQISQILAKRADHQTDSPVSESLYRYVTQITQTKILSAPWIGHSKAWQLQKHDLMTLMQVYNDNKEITKLLFMQRRHQWRQQYLHRDFDAADWLQLYLNGVTEVQSLLANESIARHSELSQHVCQKLKTALVQHAARLSEQLQHTARETSQDEKLDEKLTVLLHDIYRQNRKDLITIIDSILAKDQKASANELKQHYTPVQTPPPPPALTDQRHGRSVNHDTQLQSVTPTEDVTILQSFDGTLQVVSKQAGSDLCLLHFIPSQCIRAPLPTPPSSTEDIHTSAGDSTTPQRVPKSITITEVPVDVLVQQGILMQHSAERSQMRVGRRAPVSLSCAKQPDFTH